MQTKDKLKALYTECFTDSESCTNYLFKHRLGENNADFFETDGIISVAMYQVPKTLIYNNSAIQVPFIVGLSTAKAYRKQGLAKKIMQKAIMDMKAPFVFLYPAVKNFYEKMDFATVAFDAVIDTSYERIPASEKEIKNIYDQYTKGMDYFIHLSENDIKEKMEITRLDGGEFYNLKDNGKIIGFGNGEENLLLQNTQKQKGVMARIGNLSAAFGLLKVTINEKIKLTDSLIEKNNISFSVNRGNIIPQNAFDIELTMAELTEHFFGLGDKIKNFPKLSGYISERY